MHGLEFADHRYRIVALKGAAIQAFAAVSIHQPFRLGLVVASIGSCRQAQEERLALSLPPRETDLSHDRCVGWRNRSVRFVKDD